MKKTMWYVALPSVSMIAAALAFAPAGGAQSGAAPAAEGSSAVPRTPDGKPDLTGIYQWPSYMPGDQRGKGSASIFDRKYFAPLKPGGEPFLEPRTGDMRHDEPRDFCMPAGMIAGML